ncbi:hypothetical protein QUF80_07675 [Desulfococcaceae bacterium HSG8]|nr:hypothetical protein [Desulfococcaceae bacterium HSG8]
MIAKYPELFPPETEYGWRTKDSHISKKQGIKIRRIEIGGISYTIRPSFVMPYMTAMTDDAENALFLRKSDVPFRVIARIFGKNPMYWQRMEQSLGRNSIVGTTVSLILSRLRWVARKKESVLHFPLRGCRRRNCVSCLYADMKDIGKRI